MYIKIKMESYCMALDAVVCVCVCVFVPNGDRQTNRQTDKQIDTAIE